MGKWLDIKAGRQAWQHIQEQQLSQSDISLLLGASGGPKWFVLQGLDNFLFGEFFRERQTPLKTLGTSAGAWRFASLGRSDPAAASRLFCAEYRATVYSQKPDVQEITAKAKDLLATYITDKAIDEILNQETFLPHFTVVRARGLAAREGRLAQLTGLLQAASANAWSRRRLGYHFDRVLFHHPAVGPELSQHWDDMNLITVPLSKDNFRQALLATGSIPMVLAGVTDIPGAPPGTYRDGGIIDYHFDLDFSSEPGLVLYPHFQREIIPGWFDKRHKKRRITGQQWPNVISLMPTQTFIDALPYGKIPDRHDFAELDVASRQKFWQQATDAGYRLAEEFAEALVRNELGSLTQQWD